MGTIETTIDQSGDLTVVKATGKMTAQEFDEWRLNYYSGKVTMNTLWDIIDADLSDIKPEDIATHAQRISISSVVRKGGRTAVVVGENPLAFGLSRMREIYGEIEDSPITVQIFTSMDEAMEWLGATDTRKRISKPAKTTRSSREP